MIWKDQDMISAIHLSKEFMEDLKR